MPAPSGGGAGGWGLSAPRPAGGGSGPEDARPGVAGASGSEPQPLRPGRAAQRPAGLAPPSVSRSLGRWSRRDEPCGAAPRRSLPSLPGGAAGVGSAAPAAFGSSLGHPGRRCAGSRGRCRALICSALGSPASALGPEEKGCFSPKKSVPLAVGAFPAPVA